MNDRTAHNGWTRDDSGLICYFENGEYEGYVEADARVFGWAWVLEYLPQGQEVANGYEDTEQQAMLACGKAADALGLVAVPPGGALASRTAVQWGWTDSDWETSTGTSPEDLTFDLMECAGVVDVLDPGDGSLEIALDGSQDAPDLDDVLADAEWEAVSSSNKSWKVRPITGSRTAEGVSAPLQCMECGKKFKRKVTPTSSVKCPDCGSYDIDADYDDPGSDVFFASRYATVQWGPSEWADDGFSAYEGGVVADVYPAEARGGSFDGKPWEWDVKATATKIEYPELWDFGSADSADEAKAQAEVALLKAVEHYKDSIGPADQSQWGDPRDW